MKIIRESDYKHIISDTCGELVEMINNSDVPISLTKAEDIKPTTKHAHIKSTEIYWLLNGDIEIEIGKDTKFELIKMNSGSILVIKPGEFHRVVKSSEKNTVIVISNPPWALDDEIIKN